LTRVLDASALLAYLRDEPGAQEVADALAETAVIGAVNLGEALSKLADLGHAPADFTERLRARGILDALLRVEPVTAEDAVGIADLRRNGHRRLSLGDRACLALASRLGLPAVTADREWGELGVEVAISLIR
jgi:ribonuclease VapC